LSRALILPALLACVAGCSEVSPTVIGIDVVPVGDGGTPSILDRCPEFEEVQLGIEEFRRRFDDTQGGEVPPVCSVRPLEEFCPARVAYDLLIKCLSEAVSTD
jgi:hypothetical protein